MLSTGEWMLPISLDQRDGFGPFKGLFKELDPLRGANVFVSTDKGATWQRRGAAQFPNPDWHEHMIVERKDGSLWMLARTAQGHHADAPRPTAAAPGPSRPNRPASASPNARFHIRRLASGQLLLVKHGDAIDAHEGRVQLSAWLSDDDGKTWKGGLMLDERKGISYPDGFQAPDGTIYISYDRNRATDGEILLARFTEEDILARKLVGPKSKLKMLISRPLAPKKAGPPREGECVSRPNNSLCACSGRQAQWSPALARTATCYREGRRRVQEVAARRARGTALRTSRSSERQQPAFQHTARGQRFAGRSCRAMLEVT